jgi:peptidoglycan/xylan/chitin deacetylase (PgdA/CDA1 family)
VALVRRGPVVRELLVRLAAASGLPALARRRLRGRLAILMFHGVEPAPTSPRCWHVLDAPTLARELEHASECFHVLPLEDALERLVAGTLPDRAAALTFDDGTRNLATHAAPVLARLGLPAAVFLATGPMGTDETLWPDRLWLAFARSPARSVDLAPLGLGVLPLATAEQRGDAYASAVARLKDLPDAECLTRLDAVFAALAASTADPGPFRMLSWDEARAMAADGRVTLHPHSVTHPILSRCDDEKVEREIADSCAALERETGRPPTVFAYPNGRAQDFDERAKAALRRRGIRFALSTVGGIARRESDPFALPRLAIGSDLSFARFRLLVSGALA